MDKNEEFLQITKDSPKAYWKYWTLNKVPLLKKDLLNRAKKFEDASVNSKKIIKLQTSLSYLTIAIIQLILISAISYFLLKGIITVAIVTALTQVTANYIQTSNAALNLFIKSLGYKNLEKEYSEIPEKKMILNKVKNLKSLEIKNLSHNYGDKVILKNINLTINHGDKILITGPSGLGKSTLLKQIFNSQNLSNENINETSYLLNGKPVKNYDIRSNATYVDQDIFLINDTIANNIRLSNPDITEKELNKYAEILNLTKLIESLPDKWNTIVKDNMSNFSGGERQRIAILFGLAANKNWLFLDEINSALDKETSLKILNYLLEEKDYSIIMVANNINKEIKDKFNLNIKLS